MTDSNADKSEISDEFSFGGRVFYLLDDAAAMRKQLAGEDLTVDFSTLRDNVSTDEMTPARACYHYDEKIADYLYTGLRCGEEFPCEVGAVRSAGFGVLVSGDFHGKGSSREIAPYAEMVAGIRVVIAKSFSHIYRQNCRNLGLLTTTDFSVLDAILEGRPVPVEKFFEDADDLSRDVIRAGGLFALNRSRSAGETQAYLPSVASVPAMTLAEKIMAAHWTVDGEDRAGVPGVVPGDAGFFKTDLRFTHEYVTPIAASLYEEHAGSQPIVRSESVVFFEDHLSLLSKEMDPKLTDESLGLARKLGERQRSFAKERDIALYGRRSGGGSEGICHVLVTEKFAEPGQLIVGSDSHTCHAGVLGCIAVGMGTTDLASSWMTGDVRMRVPESVSVHVNGKLRPGVTAKDLALHILRSRLVKSGATLSRVIEFSGPALGYMSTDERATLTNMATEMGAMTAVIVPDEVTAGYLVDNRGFDPIDAREACSRWQPDAGAHYVDSLVVDATDLYPMVALPGDPTTGVPLDELADSVAVNIAYGGSCTGGKKSDMDLYAQVLRAARQQGRRVAEGVEFYIQFGSQGVKQYCEEKGYIQLFEEVGVKTIEPSCGACINAGPGVSSDPDQVTISAQNRNFPGRSGPGKVYLGSPLTVAASAIEGRVAMFDHSLTIEDSLS